MAMSYEDFLDIAKDAAKTRHPEAEVTIQKVEKLQGESYVGLSVRPEGKNAAVTMNLHELHDQVVKNPKRLAAVMSEFLSGLDKALEQIPQVDVKQFTARPSRTSRSSTGSMSAIPGIIMPQFL